MEMMQNRPTPDRVEDVPASASSRARWWNSSHGDVVIAAITSCTNTSNPSVMLAAGLLAKKAVEKGMTIRPTGQNVAGARLARGHGLSRQDRPDALFGPAGLPDGRLRLHDLYRQLRPAGAASGKDDHPKRPGRGKRAVRQPQL